jgi:hypothetical protein
MGGRDFTDNACRCGMWVPPALTQRPTFLCVIGSQTLTSEMRTLTLAVE